MHYIMYKLFGSSKRKKTKTRLERPVPSDFYSLTSPTLVSSSGNTGNSTVKQGCLNPNTADSAEKYLTSSKTPRAVSSQMPRSKQSSMASRSNPRNVDLDKTQLEIDDDDQITKHMSDEFNANNNQTKTVNKEDNNYGLNQATYFTSENQYCLPLQKRPSSKRVNTQPLEPNTIHYHDGSMAAIQKVDAIMLELHSELQKYALKEDLVELQYAVKRLQRQRQKDAKERLVQSQQLQREEEEIMRHILLLKTRLVLFIEFYEPSHNNEILLPPSVNNVEGYGYHPYTLRQKDARNQWLLHRSQDFSPSYHTEDENKFDFEYSRPRSINGQLLEKTVSNYLVDQDNYHTYNKGFYHDIISPIPLHPIIPFRDRAYKLQEDVPTGDAGWHLDPYNRYL